MHIGATNPPCVQYVDMDNHVLLTVSSLKTELKDRLERHLNTMSQNKKQEVELDKSIHTHVLHAKKSDNIIFGINNMTKDTFTVQSNFTEAGIKGMSPQLYNLKTDRVHRVSVLIVHSDKLGAVHNYQPFHL